MAALPRPVQPNDRYYYPLPLFHVAAHNVLLQHLWGAAVVLACSEVGLSQGYGMTELSGSISFLGPEEHRRAAAGDDIHLLKSVGKPLPTVELRLVTGQGEDCPPGEAGEILVRGERCMRGYWRDEAATQATLVDGWLHTGDIGRLDEVGYIYIVDRKKDMVISGGENIASREVEEVLCHHPAVRDCAIVGLPDAKWGEKVCAIIVASKEVGDDELEAFCRHQLAGYKLPRHWVRMQSLPLNAAGKVDKVALRSALATDT